MKTKRIISIEGLRKSACARLNPHLFEEKLPKKGKSKYGNKKTDVNGIQFDSAKEAKRYKELLMLMKVGEIGLLELQKEYELIVNDKIIAVYRSDFAYMTKEGVQVVEDVKSSATRKIRVYRMKKKLMKELWGITITEI